jgi:hypothetical protein
MLDQRTAGLPSGPPENQARALYVLHSNTAGLGALYELSPLFSILIIGAAGALWHTPVRALPLPVTAQAIAGDGVIGHVASRSQRQYRGLAAPPGLLAALRQPGGCRLRRGGSRHPGRGADGRYGPKVPLLRRAGLLPRVRTRSCLRLLLGRGISGLRIWIRRRVRGPAYPDYGYGNGGGYSGRHYGRHGGHSGRYDGHQGGGGSYTDPRVLSGQPGSLNQP